MLEDGIDMVLNLHVIANTVLRPVNEHIDCVFLRSKVTYTPESLEGVRTTEEIHIEGKIQPFNAKRHSSFTKIQNLWDNTTRTFNVYVVYIKGFATMRDQHIGMADDVFYARGKKYTVIENILWTAADWSELLCIESNDDREN